MARRLEPGARIYPEDLEAWEAMAGMKVSSGDALFVRTGRWAREVEHGPATPTRSAAAAIHRLRAATTRSWTSSTPVWLRLNRGWQQVAA